MGPLAYWKHSFPPKSSVCRWRTGGSRRIYVVNFFGGPIEDQVRSRGPVLVPRLAVPGSESQFNQGPGTECHCRDAICTLPPHFRKVTCSEGRNTGRYFRSSPQKTDHLVERGCLSRVHIACIPEHQAQKEVRATGINFRRLWLIF